MRYSAYEHFPAVQRLPLTPATILRWRKARGLGQGGLGKLFKCADNPNGYNRSYISKLERGHLPITKKFTCRFEIVRDQWREAHHETGRASGLVEIFSKRHVPRRIHILRPIVKCTRCEIHFEAINGRHKRCHTPECDSKRLRRKRHQNKSGRKK